MLDISIAAAFQRDLSQGLKDTAKRAQLPTDLMESAEGAISSPEVASALEEGMRQYRARSVASVEAILAIGEIPAHAADTFSAQDAAMARQQR